MSARAERAIRQNLPIHRPEAALHPQVDALLTAPDEGVTLATLNTVHDLLRFATWEPEVLKQAA